MRWTDLFDDLEAQLAAHEASELRDEVAEHTRAAWGTVRLTERLLADLGRRVRLVLRGAGPVEGVLEEVAREWLVLRDGAIHRPRETLVVLSNLLSVQGLSGRSDAGRSSLRAHPLALTQALRALSRERAVVRCALLDGVSMTGTIDRVGADHLDLSSHPEDLPRRSKDVQSVVTVPHAAVVCLTRR